ncbi:MAG: multicopper oxidase family protein [Pseudomonadota bacterium]
MNRRDVLVSSGAMLGVSCLGGAGYAVATASPGQNLKIQTARYQFRENITEGLVSLSPDSAPPVLYGTQDEPLDLTVSNTLDEYTAMHWHGIRLPNEMDGVPYLTQVPIGGGDSFRYRFTPPDAGTYWYHPHCMTMTQMARGLTGVLVIREREDPGFDGDQAINLKDFRLSNDDALGKAYSLRKAARGGTLGNVMTANWQQAPVYDHPAGGVVRLRVANTDTTRIYRIWLTSADTRVIAWDGHPLLEPVGLPTEQVPMALGPGQRADFAVAMPSAEGRRVQLMAKSVKGPKIMAGLRAVGSGPKRDLNTLKSLPHNPVAEPNLTGAETHEFVFGWSPDGTAPDNGFCGNLGKNFWSINREAWPGDNAKGTGPLAQLKLGRSYVLRLRNESPNLHPIHLHGLTFKPIRSNKRKILANWTDTALLLKDEVIDVAVVADNPGDWAFHCHVIEHQKTGLSGYLRVE